MFKKKKNSHKFYLMASIVLSCHVSEKNLPIANWFKTDRLSDYPEVLIATSWSALIENVHRLHAPTLPEPLTPWSFTYRSINFPHDTVSLPLPPGAEGHMWEFSFQHHFAIHANHKALNSWLPGQSPPTHCQQNNRADTVDYWKQQGGGIHPHQRQ